MATSRRGYRTAAESANRVARETAGWLRTTRLAAHLAPIGVGRIGKELGSFHCGRLVLAGAGEFVARPLLTRWSDCLLVARRTRLPAVSPATRWSTHAQQVRERDARI